MALTIGSNIHALRAQRGLAQSVNESSRLYERLSTGQRINRASDDAAGLAISSSISADIRIFSQAIRNANDGISAINIAQGTLSQLGDILTRLTELAEGAANGTLSSTQRHTLNQEFGQLTEEYARTLSAASFNGIDLFSPGAQDIILQLGKGINNSLSARIGREIEREVGTGEFNAASAAWTGAGASLSQTFDVNGDGVLDLLVASGGQISLSIGNGDGTFASPVATSVQTAAGKGAPTILDFAVGDLDNDGDLDIGIVADDGASDVRIFSNDGSGTFSLSRTTSYDAIGVHTDIEFGDLNGDGNLDLVVGITGSLSGFGARVQFGDGAVGFTSGGSYGGTANSFASIAIGDTNGDGVDDLVVHNDTQILLYSYNGSSFSLMDSVITAPGAATNRELRLGDVDNDGDDDIVFFAGSVARVYQVENGIFAANKSYTTLSVQGEIGDLQLADLNNDGLTDIGIVLSAPLADDIAYTFLSSSDHSYGAGHAIPSSGSGFDGFNLDSLSFGDFNGDGVVDLFASSAGSGNGNLVALAQTTQSLSLEPMDVRTRESALSALDILKSYRTKVNRELSGLGSLQSRLDITLANLSVVRENYAAAGSRITDEDIASASSELVRRQILQQTSSAVLSQANLVPQLALLLLQ